LPKGFLNPFGETLLFADFINGALENSTLQGVIHQKSEITILKYLISFQPIKKTFLS